MRTKSSKLISAIIIILLSVLVLIVAIRAISKPDSGKADNSGNESTSTEAVPTPTPEPEKLTFKKAPEGYFDDALFIGDSRTVGVSYFKNDCCLANADFFCTVGMSTYNAFTETVSIDGVGTVDLSTLLASKHYSKVYIMLGINEIGSTLDSIMERYTSMVSKIQTAYPEAIIYVTANIHVTYERSVNDPTFSNTRISELNSRMSKLADDESIFYLDPNVLFDDEGGNLSTQYSSDSAHLQSQYYLELGEWYGDNAIVKK